MGTEEITAELINLRTKTHSRSHIKVRSEEGTAPYCR